MSREGCMFNTRVSCPVHVSYHCLLMMIARTRTRTHTRARAHSLLPSKDAEKHETENSVAPL